MYDHPKIFKEALPALASSLTASGQGEAEGLGSNRVPILLFFLSK